MMIPLKPNTDPLVDVHPGQNLNQIYIHSRGNYFLTLLHFLGIVVGVNGLTFSIVGTGALGGLFSLVFLGVVFYGLSSQVKHVEVDPDGLTMNYWLLKRKRVLWVEVNEVEIRNTRGQACLVKTLSGLTIFPTTAIEKSPLLIKSIVEKAGLAFLKSDTQKALYRKENR
jgi:hypothetical protein